MALAVMAKDWYKENHRYQSGQEESDKPAPLDASSDGH
jgi:hypothetical protein